MVLGDLANKAGPGGKEGEKAGASGPSREGKEPMEKSTAADATESKMPEVRLWLEMVSSSAVS